MAEREGIGQDSVLVNHQGISTSIDIEVTATERIFISGFEN
jgi:hypothetical protein